MTCQLLDVVTSCTVLVHFIFIIMVVSLKYSNKVRSSMETPTSSSLKVECSHDTLEEDPGCTQLAHVMSMDVNNDLGISEVFSSGSIVTVRILEDKLDGSSSADQCIGLPFQVLSRDGGGGITYLLPPVTTSLQETRQTVDLNLVSSLEKPVEQCDLSMNDKPSNVSIECPHEVTAGNSSVESRFPKINCSEPQVLTAPRKCRIVVKRDINSFIKKDQAIADKEEVVVEEAESAKKIKSPKTVKRRRKVADWLAEGIDPTKLEESVDQVYARFEKGCECDGENCFDGINPEFVYKHRLNIAELTRTEHDMYLMGVTMATAANPQGSMKNAKRQRLKTSYLFLGKEVCLEAWLYFENCTLHQLKSVRKHVLAQGVSPRVHGNQGKKPHNTFPLESYKSAFTFLDNWFNNYVKELSTSEVEAPRRGGKQKPSTIYLPPEQTRKKLHNEYKNYFETHKGQSTDGNSEDLKLMGYSTFSQFLKVRFPHVRFAKVELNCAKAISQQSKCKTSAENLLIVEDTDDCNQWDPKANNVDHGYVVTVPVQYDNERSHPGGIIYVETS